MMTVDIAKPYIVLKSFFYFFLLSVSSYNKGDCMIKNEGQEEQELWSSF